MNDFLKKMFIDEAKPALDRHSGSGGSGANEKETFLNFSLNANADGYEVNSKKYDIVIPSTYDGLPVSKISNNAFYNHRYIKSVKIEEGITTIGSTAFESCDYLEKVEFPQSLKEIQTKAFETCSRLEGDFEFNDLKLTLDSTFKNTNITSIKINSPKQSYYNLNGTFYNCSKLHTVEINAKSPTIITAFKSNVFMGCVSLTNLKMTNLIGYITVGSGTSYGHLLTLDSLIGLCKECICMDSTYKLIVGSANLEKLANVYVKFTDPSVTTIASWEKGEVEVCESTDEGAMPISEYMTLKSWTLA